MYNSYNGYPCPFCMDRPKLNQSFMYNYCRACPYPYCVASSRYNPKYSSHYSNQHIPNTYKSDYNSRYNNRLYKNNDDYIELKDYGPEPFVIDIDEATTQNNTYRTALWTGDYLQLTLMSIDVGEDIGLEMHPDLDQFIRIEEGQGIVRMGDREDRLDFQENVNDDFIFIIPAGKWHNLINTGNRPLKLYSIYSPPQHPHGTVHLTKEDAMSAEEHH